MLSAGEYRLWYGEDLQGNTEENNGGTMCATVQIIGGATPIPTPNPTLAAPSATGDPHLQNVFGERFDVMRPGRHVLISIPRGTSAEGAMLRV